MDNDAMSSETVMSEDVTEGTCEDGDFVGILGASAEETEGSEVLLESVLDGTLELGCPWYLRDRKATTSRLRSKSCFCIAVTVDSGT